MAVLGLNNFRILEIGSEVSNYWETILRLWEMMSLWPYHPEHTQSCQIMGMIRWVVCQTCCLGTENLFTSRDYWLFFVSLIGLESEHRCSHYELVNIILCRTRPSSRPYVLIRRIALVGRPNESVARELL